LESATPDIGLFHPSGQLAWIFLQEGMQLDLPFFLSMGAILLLLFFSGMISGSEVAFFSLKDKLLQQIQQSHFHTDKVIARLLQSPKELLSTILIANNLINISIVILFTVTVNAYFDFGGSRALSFLVEVLLLTIILVIFGEVTPKIYANQSKLRVANYMALPLSLLIKLFKPLSSLMIRSTSLIERRLKKQRQQFSLEELKHAIDLTSSQSQSADEKTILNRIVNFSSVYVRQIMTSRLDVVAYEFNTSFSEILKDVNINRFSRVPVYKGQADNIVGVLYIKDMIPHFGQAAGFNWQKLLRKPYFVPENKMIDDLLREFQSKKVHMAIVVDEYGGFSGVITLEDILEEIVGEITDEFDEADSSKVKVDENTYIFNAKHQLTEVIKTLSLEEDAFDDIKGEAETLGGLIIEILGQIPHKGKELDVSGLHLVIEEADKRRIHRVKVILQPKED
jgi:gliding motility-associated protein GldE